MKEIWVLSVRTSLPRECYGREDLEVTFEAFDSFGKGKNAMRKVIREYAFSKNSMFDGKGNIKKMKEYIDESQKYLEDDEEGFANIYEKICLAFAGNDVSLEYEDDYSYTDYFIAFEIHGDMVSFRGDDDGPCNGYNPTLCTNIFSMNEEKDYFLYIDDLLGQDASSELYIDLKKTTIK